MDVKEKVIKAIFDEVYPISDKSLRLITEMVEYRSFPKNEVLFPLTGLIIPSILSWKGFVGATS
jgi:hypothetical protein